MKNVLKGTSPNALADYVRNHPLSDESHQWEHFKAGATGQVRAAELSERLQEDQRGLCAYCELALIPKYDFRVEHFHPKDDDASNGKNYWQLRWDNLLGCCHGGSVRVYGEPERFGAAADQHCDAPKGNQILDAVIFNPLLLPSFPRLFFYRQVTRLEEKDEVLEIVPSRKACNNLTYDGVRGCYTRAQETIVKLNLNSGTLSFLRQAMFENVKRRIFDRCKAGMSQKDAIESVARAFFPRSKKRWPMFFTVIRWMLGDVAERRLKDIGYQG